METLLLKGKLITKNIYQDLKERIEILEKKPVLYVFIVGEDSASLSYIRAKEKASEKVGILTKTIKFPDTIAENELIDNLVKIIKADDPDGVLVQFPLPEHISEEKIIEIIPPQKDVDGFHPYNLGRLLRNLRSHYPCTPMGVMEMLKYYDFDLKGKKIAIIGRSLLVGKPLSIMLSAKGIDSTVTICHSRTRDISEITKKSDIIIAAVGKPNILTKDMVSENAVIIDVGVNRINLPDSKKGYKLVGDTDFDNLYGFVRAITPVPGGVGPLTVAMLMKNTYEAAEKNQLP